MMPKVEIKKDQTAEQPQDGKLQIVSEFQYLDLKLEQVAQALFAKIEEISNKQDEILQLLKQKEEKQ